MSVILSVNNMEKYYGSKGRGHAILKRTSHITVILDVKKAEGEI